MKALNKMNSRERAILMHRLLPSEIKALLDFSYYTSKNVATHRMEIHIKHLTDRLKDCKWPQLAAEWLVILEREKDRLIEFPAVFADLLFNERTIPLALYCLQEYASASIMENSDIAKLIDLLFL
jgi:hypothetical protein